MLNAADQIDIVVTNAGGPLLGMWHDWGRDDFIAACDANMLTPISLVQATVPGMMDRGWGRVINITSQSVKAPSPVLVLPNTARQVADAGVTINNLLPGLHDTDRAKSLEEGVVKAQGITMDSARAACMATIPAGRYGTVEEFGATCAFLCSQFAGFIVGQNVLLDGGGVNATDLIGKDRGQRGASWLQLCARSLLIAPDRKMEKLDANE